MSQYLRYAAGTPTWHALDINHCIIVHRSPGAVLRQWGAATLAGREGL